MNNDQEFETSNQTTNEGAGTGESNGEEIEHARGEEGGDS